MDYRHKQKLTETTSPLSDKLRSTAGVGLAFRIGQKARIEFNYCQPLSFEPSDRVKKGFQFGIGYEFI